MTNTAKSAKPATQLRNEKMQRIGRAYAKAVATALTLAGCKDVKVGRGKFEDTHKLEWRAEIFAFGYKLATVWVDTETYTENYRTPEEQEVTRAMGHMLFNFPTKNVPAGMPAKSAGMREAIKTQLKQSLKVFASWSDFPWYHNDRTSYTMKFTGGELCRKASYTPPQSNAPRYDPRQAYLDRQTPAWHARQARIAQHQFASDIGGCSANYRF